LSDASSTITKRASRADALWGVFRTQKVRPAENGPHCVRASDGDDRRRLNDRQELKQKAATGERQEVH